MDKNCIADEVLVKRFREGDNQSFDQLINKYQVLVFSLCLNLLEDEESAGALVKDIFVEISRQVKDTHSVSFETLVHRVTYDLALSKMMFGFLFDDDSLPYSADSCYSDIKVRHSDNRQYGKH